jgi:hypothetical protein
MSWTVLTVRENSRLFDYTQFLKQHEHEITEIAFGTEAFADCLKLSGTTVGKASTMEWDTIVTALVVKDAFLKNQTWKVRLLRGSMIVAAVDANKT